MSKSVFIDILKEAAQDFTDSFVSDEIEYKKVVLFDGNPDANIMVVARDLGKDEVKLNKPLIGQAGSLFRKISVSLGFTPTVDFFMCNTVPLKPFNNIAFSDDLRDKFSWILKELVYIVSPSYILCLGRESTEFFLKRPLKNMKEVVATEFSMYWGNKNIFVYPSYHPSYILRLSRQGIKGAESNISSPLCLIRNRLNER